MKTLHDFELWESVVCVPEEDDLFQHEFRGVIVGFRYAHNLISVEDGDGSVFDVYPYQILDEGTR